MSHLVIFSMFRSRHLFYCSSVHAKQIWAWIYFLHHIGIHVTDDAFKWHIKPICRAYRLRMADMVIDWWLSIHNRILWYWWRWEKLSTLRNKKKEMNVDNKRQQQNNSLTKSDDNDGPTTLGITTLGITKLDISTLITMTVIMTIGIKIAKVHSTLW